ncbi:MAG: hypothetical protein ABI281_13055, partial [Caldimonas sp.]
MKSFFDSFYGRTGAMWALALAAVLVLLPAALESNAYTLHLLFLVFVFATLGHAWNLLAGYAGLLSFGQQVFIGLGGFAQAMIFYYTPASIWLARRRCRRRHAAEVERHAAPALLRGAGAACRHHRDHLALDALALWLGADGGARRRRRG